MDKTRQSALPPPSEVDPNLLAAVRTCLDTAAKEAAIDALPHLRQAADRLTRLLDETMAAAAISGHALRSTAHQAGLTENAVGPRLARTRTLGAYANPQGRVTAASVARARYDQESGTPRPAPPDTAPMRFQPRRPTR